MSRYLVLLYFDSYCFLDVFYVLLVYSLFFFFFSSRRRHTRCSRDWSSDVCSSDLDLSYTDPAFRDSRVSMTVGVQNTRLRYTISDLGQLRRRGGNLQFGFPLFNDRYTRLFVSYAIDDQTFTGATTGLASLSCNNCIRSTIGFSVMRDTRIDLPFPTAGTMHSVGLSQNGGPPRGTRNFPRAGPQGPRYAPPSRGGPPPRRGQVLN